MKFGFLNICFIKCSTNFNFQLFLISVDSLGDKIYCWDLILLFVFFKFLEHGFLYNIRQYLWTKVENIMSRETEIKIFTHIHNLSLRWHLARKTGTALSTLNSGGNSILSLIQNTIFDILPQLIDIISSMTFLSIAFNWYFGIVLIVPMCLYLCKYDSYDEHVY